MFLIYETLLIVKRFDPTLFYSILKSSAILDPDRNLVVRPLEDGVELVAEYYAKKHRASISLPKQYSQAGSFFIDLASFSTSINEYLKDIRKGGIDCRHAFLVGAATPHASPIIYMRQNGEEGLLLADSMGGTTAGFIATIIENLNIYVVEKPRLSDFYSCYTDALVFCRDTTAMVGETNEYYIPNLLQALKARSMVRMGYFAIKLPDELLKTTQLPEFLSANQENSRDRKIHKKETLGLFRERYTEKNVSVKRKKKPIDMASYARKKGIKFADIIEIQFYINQISQDTKDAFTDRERQLFIKQAKGILLSQGVPHVGRTGLYLFSREVIKRLNPQHVFTDSDAPPMVGAFVASTQIYRERLDMILCYLVLLWDLIRSLFSSSLYLIENSNMDIHPTDSDAPGLNTPTQNATIPPRHAFFQNSSAADGVGVCQTTAEMRAKDIDCKIPGVSSVA